MADTGIGLKKAGELLNCSKLSIMHVSADYVALGLIQAAWSGLQLTRFLLGLHRALSLGIVGK